MNHVSNIFNKTHLQKDLLGQLPLPKDIQDYVFSFCEGYERSCNAKNLGIRSFALPVHMPLDITTISPLLELNVCTISRSDGIGATATFIEKKNTENSKGYVSKMVTTDEEEVSYTWIQVIQH